MQNGQSQSCLCSRREGSWDFKPWSWDCTVTRDLRTSVRKDGQLSHQLTVGPPHISPSPPTGGVWPRRPTI